MGKALYRKYRPRALAEVIGQEHVTQTLARALKAGRISHAYLFTGPHGTGKTTVARILAHQINKLPYSDDTHLDIIEIDAASNRRIDDIRDLREKVHIAPVSATFKVYIIDEAHMLTGESFNALLKTLEEPPAHVIFILATTESHKLPATIISRTQHFGFRPVTLDKIIAHLGKLATQEEIAVSDEALKLIAAYGNGSFRDSIGLLDQLAHAAAGEISTQDVVQILGLAPQGNVKAITEAILAGDAQAAALKIRSLEAAGTHVGTLVNQLNRALAEEAPARPDLYRLIDSLLDAPRAYDPGLKLLTSIMVFISENNPAHPPAKKQPAKPRTPPEAPPRTSPAQISRSAPKEEVIIAEAEFKPPATLKNFKEQDWQTVLAHLKKKSPPIYAVAKQAQAGSAHGKLVLAFKYSLHSKKIDDAKGKAELAASWEAALGTAAPEITVKLDKNAQASAPAPATPEISNIAAIMGGGEVIENAVL